MCKLKNYTFEDLDFIDICLFELGDNKTRAEIKAEIEKRLKEDIGHSRSLSYTAANT